MRGKARLAVDEWRYNGDKEEEDEERGINQRAKGAHLSDGISKFLVANVFEMPIAKISFTLGH